MIVITTPTGQIGRQVPGNLLDSGQELRVIARDPSQLPAEVREDLDIVDGSMATRRLWTRHLPAPMPFSGCRRRTHGRLRSKQPSSASPGPPFGRPSSTSRDRMPFRWAGVTSGTKLISFQETALP